jgi:hypothetical protein
MISQDKDSIESVECRFSVYIPPPEPGMPDYHLIKESVNYKDGTSKPRLQLVKDFKRDFWVTKKGYQKHNSKKEWEDLDNLIEFKTTQSKLYDTVARALNAQWMKGDPRKLSSSPYLYGSDILSTSIIKQMYMDKYPDAQTYYSVAVFDVETDVIHGHGQIVMATITYKDVVYTAVTKEFVAGVSNLEARVEQSMQKYLGEYVSSRNIKSELIVVDSEIDVVRLTIGKAHELQPDLLAIWNLDFDIGTKIIEACNRAQVDPKDIFSDPSVPAAYRFFKYKQGKKQKVTASGVVTPIKPAAQWHTVFCPSSFYCIDAMCVYKQVRVAKQEEQSYSLDFILNKNLGIRKLKFEEADHVEKLKWHELMQQSYKVEYIIYNRFDCISIEVLDEKTLDLKATLPTFAGCSDFSIFASQPKRAQDKLHWYILKNKRKVMGTAGSDIAEDVDAEFDLSGWIITLEAQLVADNGICLTQENDELRSAARAHTGD